MTPQNSNRLSASSSQMIGSESPEHFPSPNAIPPRISSNGIHSPGASPAKSALKPLSEASWMSQSLGPAAENPVARQFTHRREASTPVVSEALGSTWSAEKEKIVLGPYQYLVEIPGKDIRRQLIESFNEWLKVPPEALEIITDAVTMLHTASLLIDDVEDSSLLRRGSPVAHSIFGIPQTLNSANYVYFKALETLFKLKNPAVIQIYSEELCNLHRGQGMDLFWRDTLTVPTEDDYLEMVGNKTGGLFRLAIKLMQAESTNTEVKDCAELVNLIGLIFQIRDDYMNLWSKDYTANKGLCEDLTEGKFSFPVIHAIRANESNRVLINILKQKTQDDTVKMYAVQYLESMGSFEYSRKTIRKLSDKAFAMIEALDAGKGEGEKLKKIVARFTALE